MTPAAVLYARGLRGESPRLRLRERDGASAAVPLAQWLGPVTRGDESVLARCAGPVLDVGCGPGRHIAALARLGVAATGLDVSPAAVATARRRGAQAVEGSVFGAVPAAGSWRTVLLLDGNIGIGGRPRTLLRRAVELGARDVRVLVELDPPGGPSGRVHVRLEDDGAQSAWFPWAKLSADAVADVARGAGLVVTELWTQEDRWFAALDPR